MDPIPLSAPFGGVNEKVPKIALQSPNCENLLNFNVTQEGTILRNGNSVYTQVVTPNTHYNEHIFGKYGEVALFELYTDITTSEVKIYDIDAGTLAYTSAALGQGVFGTQFFNNYLFFFTPTLAYTPGIYYNGSTFGVIGYSGSGFYPRGGGNNFKNRNYIIQDEEPAYWYSEPYAISGALRKVDLGTVVKQSCILSNIASITLSDQVSTVALQTFVFSTGEILFYSGSYPDSSDWQLVGQAKTGQLVSKYDSVFSYQGDAILLSDSGIISLRDLFLKGSNAAIDLSVNKNVQRTWTSLIRAARAYTSIYNGPLTFSIKGVWDEAKSRLIIFVGYDYPAGTPGNFFFIFDTVQASWSFHHSGAPPIATTMLFHDIIYYKNKVLIAPFGASSTITVLEKEGATNFTDKSVGGTLDIGVIYEVLSAPVANGRAYVQKAAGLDVIVETDLYSETEYQLIRDFGVETTNAQKVPSQPSGLQKPFVNMGIEGSYIQYKISGTTTTGKTVGYKLYGTNFWTEQGNAPR